MKRIASAAAVALFCAALVAILYLAPEQDRPAVRAEAAATTTDSVLVGGVLRPATDIEPVDKPDPEVTTKRFNSGTVQGVPANANAYVASVAQARKEKRYPERLSILHQPKAFNLENYLLDPQAYLTTVEPARALKPAEPGVGVPLLQRLSPRRHKINQGESVVLLVKTLPEMPVTFTSVDLGAFENQLTSITVKADLEGIAKATFTGTPGTYFNVDILAASPVAAGTARFIVFVVPPEATN